MTTEIFIILGACTGLILIIGGFLLLYIKLGRITASLDRIDKNIAKLTDSIDPSGMITTKRSFTASAQTVIEKPPE